MKRTSAFIRTDKAIQNALITLLKKKSFEKITVQDILDETPVTRATFYKHYHDKYEIAERMLEEYQNLYAESYDLLLHTDIRQYPRVIPDIIDVNRDFIQALMKIHTDRVDLRESMLESMRSSYLSDAHGPNAPEEARLYAQLMVELQMIFLERDNKKELNGLYSIELPLPVMLKLLHLDGDEETLQFLQKKISLTF